VQPNVPQHEKWKPEFVMRNWQQLVQLSTGPGLKDGMIIVWPEAAPPFFMLSTDGALEAVASFLPDKSVLLTGTQRVERGEPNRYFNSMVAIDGQGRVLATHDKSHLVPFGEYLPLFQLLQPLGITQLTGSNGGFSEGAGVRTIEIAGVPSFGVLICYEIIFPGNVVEPGARPQWLVNMTDDSWFGPWAGPFRACSPSHCQPTPCQCTGIGSQAAGLGYGPSQAGGPGRALGRSPARVLGCGGFDHGIGQRSGLPHRAPPAQRRYAARRSHPEPDAECFPGQQQCRRHHGCARAGYARNPVCAKPLPSTRSRA
jgi:hypothetical protein